MLLFVSGDDANGRAVFRLPGQPAGVAVSGGRVWVAAPQAAAVTILDAQTGAVTGRTVRTGGSPARLALGADGAWIADTARGVVVPVRQRRSASIRCA